MYSCVRVCVTESKPTATFTTFSPPTVATVTTETRKPLTATTGTFVITDDTSICFLLCTAKYFFENMRDVCRTFDVQSKV